MNLTYKFEKEEPAICIELYLPKKPEFQGTLYDTLTDGFDYEKVEQHFVENKSGIQKLFKRRNIGLEKYDIELIKYMNKMFRGYSAYEVDGVFKSEKKQPYTERTQVIRMLFTPDYLKLRRDHGDTVYQEAMECFQNVKIPTVRFDGKSDGSTALGKLENWSYAVLLFVYGYIVFNITEKILEFAVKEEEIWVVSQWNPLINKILLTGGLFCRVSRHIMYYDVIGSSSDFSSPLSVRWVDEYNPPCEIDLSFGQIDMDIFGSGCIKKEETKGGLDSKCDPLVDRDGNFQIPNDESVHMGDAVTFEVRSGYRLCGLEFDNRDAEMTLLRWGRKSGAEGLLYWFTFKKDCEFMLTGKMRKDSRPSFLNQIKKDLTNLKLRRELAEASIMKKEIHDC